MRRICVTSLTLKNAKSSGIVHHRQHPDSHRTVDHTHTFTHTAPRQGDSNQLYLRQVTIMLKPRHIPLLSAGVFVYAATTYTSYHFYKVYNLPSPPAQISDPKYQASQEPDAVGVYSGLAESYDDKIGWDEFFMGFGWRRWNLIRKAKVRIEYLERKSDATLRRRYSHLVHRSV
jgi:hypothetical protein